MDRIFTSPNVAARRVYARTEPIGTLTPWAAFLALDEGHPAALLESARTDARTGRYSIVAARPSAMWYARGAQCTWVEGGRRRAYAAEPISELRRIMRSRRVVAQEGLPPFVGGAIACVSYEARHAFERLPQRALDDLRLPHWHVLLCDDVLVFDHLRGSVTAFAAAERPSAIGSAGERARALLDSARTPPLHVLGPVTATGPVRSSFGRERFTETVRRILRYIAAGDVYQVNLAQRLAVGLRGDLRTLYGALRTLNPSPFASFVRSECATHVGSSPERLVSLRGRRAETRPIAGTRPRGGTAREDELLRAELLLNEKERAEHVMLVDLERNDLGRVCRYGSVRVDELMVLERYSHVNHIVSNVVGELRPDRDALDLLAAMFPGGTITGCPKIRCMEIIDELEPVARHAYTGSVGYLSDTGDMDLNIVIRTITATGGSGYVAVGAGIVADSVPEREYDETLHKAKALLAALETASGLPSGSLTAA